MPTKFKLIILSFALAIGFYFRADILNLFPSTVQKISDIEKKSIPAFDKFKEDISAVVSNGGEVIAPEPLIATEESITSYLTQPGTIKETNMRRAENGLPVLKENAKLDAAAKAKADDLFEKQYFEHMSPDGKGPSDLAKAADYSYLIIGENLALGNFENDTKLVDAWMASPGHRANILNNKYIEIGVAVEMGMYEGKSVWIAVQEFGRPASACPKVDAELKAKIDTYNIEIESMSQTIDAVKFEMDNIKVTRDNYAAYSAKVDEYNSLIRQYNSLIDNAKLAVAEYNIQVKAYNECLK